MKKVVLGCTLLLAGILSDAMLFAGSMANDWTINGQHSAIWVLSRYGLLPLVLFFGLIALLGIAITLWGILAEK